MIFNIDLDPKYCRCKTDKDKACVMLLSQYEGFENDTDKLYFNSCVWFDGYEPDGGNPCKWDDITNECERAPECIEMELKQVKDNITLQ